MSEIDKSFEQKHAKRYMHRLCQFVFFVFLFDVRGKRKKTSTFKERAQEDIISIVSQFVGLIICNAPLFPQNVNALQSMAQTFTEQQKNTNTHISKSVANMPSHKKTT